MYIYLCIYIYIYICIYLYIYTHTHTRARTCICMEMLVKILFYINTWADKDRHKGNKKQRRQTKARKEKIPRRV